MLFEFFTVLLMKRFLFKIFFQNKYYERQGEMCFLACPRPGFRWGDGNPPSRRLCPPGGPVRSLPRGPQGSGGVSLSGHLSPEPVAREGWSRASRGAARQEELGWRLPGASDAHSAVVRGFVSRRFRALVVSSSTPMAARQGPLRPGGPLSVTGSAPSQSWTQARRGEWSARGV